MAVHMDEENERDEELRGRWRCKGCWRRWSVERDENAGGR